jgi:hypothetical protein
MHIRREAREGGLAVILNINALFATRLDHENGVLKPGLLAIRDLALAVDIPDRRSQRLCHIWPFFYQGIPDCVCRCTAGGTTGLPGSAE